MATVDGQYWRAQQLRARTAARRLVAGGAGVLGSGMLGMALFLVHPGIGTAIVVAVAALVTGMLLGFLFGLPRSPHAREGGDPSFGINTNLEQISDWLTKILVGVGLVQATQVGDGLRRLVTVVAAGLGGPGAEPIAGALLVCFSVAGFLIGYVFTRIDLHTLFAWIVSTDLREIAREAGEQAAQQRLRDSGLPLKGDPDGG